MHKDTLVALIGNPLAWLAGAAWGAIASAATALYFITKWALLLWDRYKGNRQPEED